MYVLKQSISKIEYITRFEDDVYEKDQVECLDITCLIILVVTENDMIINLKDFLLIRSIRYEKCNKFANFFYILVRNPNRS